MIRRVSASDAKNNFGGLLEQVAAHGRVDITKHGRVVAVLLAPHLLEPRARRGTETHMIPADKARAATMVRAPAGFDDP